MIVLMYHDIIDDPIADASGFRGAAANHYKLSPTTFVEHLAAGPSAAPHILFTFDDGGCSAINPCADLLEQTGVRGLFFVPSDYIGTHGFCTGAQLRELHARGHTIGSHSASHPVPISNLDDSALADEWVSSRGVLQELLGCAIVDASVPGGFTSPRVERAAMNAGYSRLFTSEPTRSVRMVGAMTVHGRYAVTRKSSVETIATVLGGSSWPWIRQAAWWKSKQIVKAMGGAAWLRFRNEYFSRVRR